MFSLRVRLQLLLDLPDSMLRAFSELICEKRSTEVATKRGHMGVFRSSVALFDRPSSSRSPGNDYNEFERIYIGRTGRTMYPDHHWIM